MLTRSLPFLSSLLDPQATSRRLGRGGRPLRIAYGRIFHEACAHSPVRTTRQDFERFHHLAGDELAAVCTVRGSELAGYLPHAELTGFVQAARVAGDVETVPLASSLTIPSGPLTAGCFDWLLADLEGRLERASPNLDGVYLALHGSMQVDGLGRPPEAVVLERVRNVVGPTPQIAVSYDLHANLSAGLCDPATVLVGYRTNPHWDLAPTGFRAGNRLIRSLRRHVRPTAAWRKLPMVLGGGTTIDFLAPMRSVFKWMRRRERRDARVLAMSLFMVHPYTSAPDLGWAAHVVTDDNPELASELADELADRAWAQRKVPIPPFYDAQAGIQRARESPWRRLGPVSLVDVDDIVGAGAPGGNTHVLRALTAQPTGLRAYVPLHDPAAVDQLWDVPIGSRVEVTLRGTPGYGMPEITLPEAVVAARLDADMGRLVRVDTGRTHIAVCDRSPLPIHPKFWRELGLDARKADLIVQKNFFHYRMFYATTSFAHVPIESDGATSLDRVRNRKYRIPVYPAADVADWRPSDKALRDPHQPW